MPACSRCSMRRHLIVSRTLWVDQFQPGPSLYIGAFMLTSALGVVAVDVFGTRFIPSLDAKVALAARGGSLP